MANLIALKLPASSHHTTFIMSFSRRRGTDDKTPPLTSPVPIGTVRCYFGPRFYSFVNKYYPLDVSLLSCYNWALALQLAVRRAKFGTTQDEQTLCIRGRQNGECPRTLSDVYPYAGVILRMPGHIGPFKARSEFTSLTYTLKMTHRTGEFYGMNEALFSSALVEMVFNILVAWPLIVVGVAGLISLFYIVKQYDASLYPRFMAWACILGVMELFREFSAKDNSTGFMSCITTISLWHSLRPRKARVKPHMEAVVPSVSSPTNAESEGNTYYLFPETQGIPSCIAEPYGDYMEIFATSFGFLKMLFYNDHIGSLALRVVDFFLLSYATFIVGIMGLPMPNGRIPQASVHTDSLTIYETRLEVIHTANSNNTEIRKMLVGRVANYAFPDWALSRRYPTFDGHEFSMDYHGGWSRWCHGGHCRSPTLTIRLQRKKYNRNVSVLKRQLGVLDDALAVKLPGDCPELQAEGPAM
ncbi:uncharacterized protein BDR25DRAFT_363015 [Lindgomyces ingoldianus]|uniref:Uncharacterized protein n=1 Tax=Lindgomyces ingoldianus TaxID=673940 RepID=A0ACB6QAW7_9PLEO|nr:uncharacterized protein BDR25DRAFT_363015 [Lindgomyces ingoldianus]KAF2463295.1 hypothetical protein BDR25DRAFT_363015 [Lindgomyces ingoldianus]